MLDAVLESHPALGRCAVACVHCGIRFLTHPRNADRRNLRCPFGCRQHHRRQSSNQRSTAYYSTAAGKAKKKRLNARRSGACSTATSQESAQLPPSVPPPAEPSPAESRDGSSIEVALPLAGVVLDVSCVASSRMLPYVRLVVSLVEGLEVSLEEVVDWLRQAMRQHRIAWRRRADYILAFLHQHPP